MSSDPPPSGRVRGFFQRVGHGAKKELKKAFKRDGQAPTSRPSSVPPREPSADPPSHPTPPDGPTSARIPLPPAQSQPSVVLPQPVASLGQPASTTSHLANNGNQSANMESSLAMAAKKAGADAWSGLKLALELLKESSDVFPPVKSAVAGFLGVVDIFEVSEIICCVFA